jgi:hypothetical protein
MITHAMPLPFNSVAFGWSGCYETMDFPFHVTIKEMLGFVSILLASPSVAILVASSDLAWFSIP